MADSSKALTIMTIEELNETLAKLERAIKSTTGFLATATRSYNRVRQMRGANAHQRAWDFQAQIDKHRGRLVALETERGDVAAEMNRRAAIDPAG